MGGHHGLGGLFKSVLGAIGLGGSNGGQKMVVAETPGQPIIDTANDQTALDAEQNDKKKRANARGLNNNLLAGDTSSSGIGRHNLLGD